MNHQFGPTRATLAIVQQRRRRKTYSEVEGDLGSNLVDLAEEAGLKSAVTTKPSTFSLAESLYVRAVPETTDERAAKVPQSSVENFIVTVCVVKR